MFLYYEMLYVSLLRNALEDSSFLNKIQEKTLKVQGENIFLWKIALIFELNKCHDSQFT